MVPDEDSGLAVAVGVVDKIGPLESAHSKQQFDVELGGVEACQGLLQGSVSGLLLLVSVKLKIIAHQFVL